MIIAKLEKVKPDNKVAGVLEGVHEGFYVFGPVPSQRFLFYTDGGKHPGVGTILTSTVQKVTPLDGGVLEIETKHSTYKLTPVPKE